MFTRRLGSLQIRSNAVRTMSVRPLKEGSQVPNVVFKPRVRDEKLGGDNPFKWKDVTSNDLFANKRVVVFALPGGNGRFWFRCLVFIISTVAFTPTCSSTHLPGYEKHYGKKIVVCI